MMIAGARYITPPDSPQTLVEVVIDGAFCTVPLDTDGYLPNQIKAWIAAGNEPDAFVAPAVAPPAIDGLTFLARFTATEYAAIISAANAQLAAGDPQLSLWIDMLRLRGEIELDGTTAQAAKNGLVAAGLLAPQRADAIFAR